MSGHTRRLRFRQVGGVLADLPVTPHVRDRVTIGTTAYEVTSYEPDGSGMATLPLTVP